MAIKHQPLFIILGYYIFFVLHVHLNNTKENIQISNIAMSVFGQSPFYGNRFLYF